jgi:outer membrane receptor protein involved in Fe transport
MKTCGHSRTLVDSGQVNFSAAETAQPYLNSASVGGVTIGFPYASFVLGAADSATINRRAIPKVRKWAYSMYLQDTWKITHRLTLDYGLRWDLQNGWHEVHSRSSSFAQEFRIPRRAICWVQPHTKDTGKAAASAAFTRTYPYAVGPRLGIAYQLDNKTVIRAGWGIVYGQTPVLSYFTTATVGVGFNTLNLSNSTGLFGDPHCISRMACSITSATYMPLLMIQA